MLKQIIIFALALSLMANFAYAAGLSTTFSEVTLEGLEIGKNYSTKELAGLPLAVVNTGDESIDLKAEVLLPDVSELKEGYESIPDINWIKLKRTSFKNIKPKKAAVTDVKISIPADDIYKGKRYHVFIWTHSVGSVIGVGLKSKLLFTIKE